MRKMKTLNILLKGQSKSIGSQDSLAYQEVQRKVKANLWMRKDSSVRLEKMMTLLKKTMTQKKAAKMKRRGKISRNI